MKSISQWISVNLLVESTGIEPVTSCLQGRRSPSWANPPLGFVMWWAKRGSLSCGKATTVTTYHRYVVKSRLSSHFDRLLSCFKKWWAKMDSNHRPHDYQSCALASWAIGPYQLHFLGTFYLYPVNWITRRFSEHLSDLRTLQVDALLYLKSP